MLTPFRPPPEDYYQNNCATLLRFVLQTYGSLLVRTETETIEGFLGASNDAQRLMARLLTRKGPLFRPETFKYNEIDDPDCALNELCRLGLLEKNPPMGADGVLSRLTKLELVSLVPMAANKHSKAQLLQLALSGRTDTQVCRLVYRAHKLVRISHEQIWQLFLFLYFGERRQDWSAFVLRDLGQTRYEALVLTPRFKDREALLQALEYLSLSDLSHRVSEGEKLTRDLLQILEPLPIDRWLARRRNKAILRIARHHERQADYEEALYSFSLVDVHPARERRVRILTKLGLTEAAKKLVSEIAQVPWSEEELQFVERFGKRNAGYQPPINKYVISQWLDSRDTEASIEQQAGEILIRSGRAHWVIHAENTLVRTLTGLLYWPIVFAPVQGVFTNPFQAAPNDLYQGDFYAARKESILEHEVRLESDTDLIDVLTKTASEKFGIANDLVSWNLLKQVSLEELLEYMPVADIRRLAKFMIRNLSERRSGLPDLFAACRDGSYELIEVKGPGDQLQPGQRVWLRHLKELDIPASVMRLQ
ncbi:MAG: hypothetical protein ACI9ON_002807 [Limisphaerales bacterium]|jgi:hypothetical protein